LVSLEKTRLVNRLVCNTGFVLLATVLLIGPWLFGAWEMWWFWPLAGILFVATGCFAFRVVIGRAPDRKNNAAHRHTYLLVSLVPFMCYALVRFAQTFVYMDAERSFLLFMLPVLIAVQIVFGMSGRQSVFLYRLIFFNLILLGMYGVTNHVIGKNTHVLWAQAFGGYQTPYLRATGSYFCPDHFSGIMEILFCLATGLLLDRASRRWLRWTAFAAAALAVVGVVLSKSRGGGLTILILLPVIFVTGFSQWPVRLRWRLRAAALGIIALALAGFTVLGQTYMTRFSRYFEWEKSRGQAWEERQDALIERLKQTSRGRMIPAAVRAWKSRPWLGIGPGMHQNVWPHIAPTPDGDRERGIWPSQLNTNFHSYEVHSDWIQLLEEYGALGFLLFLWPAVSLTGLLANSLRRSELTAESICTARTLHGDRAPVMGALLALLAMAFHSLGDFNLQMPATGWMFAALIAIALKCEGSKDRV
jgi:O-antigen ligase